MAELGNPVAVYDIASGPYEASVFYTHVNANGYNNFCRKNWPSEITRIPEKIPSFCRVTSSHSDVAIVEVDGALVMITLEHGEARIFAGAKTTQAADQAIEWLRDNLIPEMPPYEDGRRPITFWTWGPYGPESTVRQLDVPTWENVQGNYNHKCTEELRELMSFRPSTAGQLLLWRGSPGTGKTWALRALIWEWRQWANFHYVVDPDQFFGDHAAYLTRVLFSQDDEIPEYPGQKPKHEPRWKILILEDCGELLSKDARERSGQGLSRLLNLVDGLIGQGLRVLVLVTTNEELGVLHDAIRRPGRCAANIEFQPLTSNEISQWCETHGVPHNRRSSATLAELYAHASGSNKRLREEKLVGFASVLGLGRGLGAATRPRRH